MKLEKIIAWMDGVLKPERFDDVSNNGLQIARSGADVKKVAFAVDGSLRSVKAAAEAGAQLLVVHHGISWGGGLRRITDGAYGIVKAAMDADLALYASHLPLDANKRCGNNWEIARALGLKNTKPAFNYHGNVIGVVGKFKGNVVTLEKTINTVLRVHPCSHFASQSSLSLGGYSRADTAGQYAREARALRGEALTLGLCSGGAGSFAPDAKALGCDLFLTGEADWGEVIAAENVGMPMLCAGHYETETFGVKGLMREVKKALKVATTFVALALCLNVIAEPEKLKSEVEVEERNNSALQLQLETSTDEPCDFSRWYVGLSGQLVLPQGGSKMRRLGGAALQFGWCWSESLAFEGEAAWLEDRCGLAARARIHFNMLEAYDKLFGYSRFDPFVTLGAQGWVNKGQVGPAAGLGALYYLTDHWALRGDATATLGLETDVEMIYALGVGVQYSF